MGLMTIGGIEYWVDPDDGARYPVTNSTAQQPIPTVTANNFGAGATPSATAPATVAPSNTPGYIPSVDARSFTAPSTNTSGSTGTTSSGSNPWGTSTTSSGSNPWGTGTGSATNPGNQGYTNPATAATVNASSPSYRYNASTATANTVNPLDPNSHYTAATVTPSDASLVENRMSGLLNQNSNYMQLARTQGLQQAAQRGLLNSSMAVGAAQNAAIQSALPIAQADASTNAQFQIANQNAQNQAGQFNATAFTQQTANNQSALNQTSQFNATAGNQALQFNASTAAQIDLANQAAANQMTMAEKEQANRIALAQIDQTTRENLMAMEAQYRNEMQSSQSASSFYTQIAQNISAIEQSKDMNSAAKTQAIANQMARLKEGLQVFSAIGGTDISSLLNGGAFGTTPSTGTTGNTSNTGSTQGNATADTFSFIPSGLVNRTQLATSYNTYRNGGGTLSPTDWYSIVYPQNAG